MLDGQVARRLAADAEARELYLTAVVARVLAMPWDDAASVARGGPVDEPDHLGAFAAEVTNAADAGARWCSIVLLARARRGARKIVDGALMGALRTEQSGEHLRAIGYALAGLDPVAA